MEKQITSILKVLALAERLKFELRHSYTSSGRKESVAEHTWRMSLMAVLIEPLSQIKNSPCHNENAVYDIRGLTIQFIQNFNE